MHPSLLLYFSCMNDCFRIEKVQTGIYLITEPYFLEHANIFLIKGSPFDLLIDAGLGLCNLKRFLIARGFSPKIITTHGHFDHIGGLSHFTTDDILIPLLSVENLGKKNLWGSDLLKPEDFDSQLTHDVIGKSPGDICADFAVQPPPIIPFEQTEIRTGRYVLCIIPLPGHTNDSIVLYDEYNGILFTGDMLYDGKPYAMFPNSDKDTFKQSLRYLQTLDFDIVFPGHNQILNRTQAMRAIERWKIQITGE